MVQATGWARAALPDSGSIIGLLEVFCDRFDQVRATQRADDLALFLRRDPQSGDCWLYVSADRPSLCQAIEPGLRWEPCNPPRLGDLRLLMGRTNMASGAAARDTRGAPRAVMLGA